MVEPRFLMVEEVMRLHERAILKFGGALGLRDPGLLESAVMAPQASFGGEFLYDCLEAMAATYWYSLVGNHPFIDGNKRVGLYACDAFLQLNGLELRLSEEDAERVTLAIAKGELTKDEAIEIVKKSVGPLEL